MSSSRSGRGRFVHGSIFTINIVNVNEAPTNLNLAGSSLTLPPLWERSLAR